MKKFKKLYFNFPFFSLLQFVILNSSLIIIAVSIQFFRPSVHSRRCESFLSMSTREVKPLTFSYFSSTCNFPFRLFNENNTKNYVASDK